MANDKTTVFASGKIFWAKVLGEPVNNYEGTAREWTLEFVPDDTTFLKEQKLLDRLKDKEYGEAIRLKQAEYRNGPDGEKIKNEPIRIYDENNEPWEASKLIGNGSEIDIKLSIKDWGKGKKKGIYVTAIRVTKHIPYVSNEFGAMDGDKTPPKKAANKTKAGNEFDSPVELDDEMPF